MYLILIVGETGSGKSSIAKSIWKKSTHAVVFDFQNEYDGEYYPNAGQDKFKLSPTTHKVDDIFELDKVVTHYTFIIEEATGLFPGSRVPEPFIQRILSKRHTKNKWVMIFHSIQDIPPRFFRFADVIFLFKTEDFEKDVRAKVPHYVEDFKRLQTSVVRKQSPSGNYTISDYVIIEKTNLIKEL